MPSRFMQCAYHLFLPFSLRHRTTTGYFKNERICLEVQVHASPVAVALAYFFRFFSTNCGSHTSLTTPTPVRKYVEVKIHVPMHVYITQPAYNNEHIRLEVQVHGSPVERCWSFQVRCGVCTCIFLPLFFYELMCLLTPFHLKPYIMVVSKYKYIIIIFTL